MSDANNSVHIKVSTPLPMPCHVMSCHEHSKSSKANWVRQSKRQRGTYSEIAGVGIEIDMDLVDEIGRARDTQQGRSRVDFMHP